ncbi:bifunctional metallophosphatase/5'-nucleotidase [Mucilaginibacter sp. 10I4]|uniref:bifunctional metallophosphatase/5'-nucleotidase n=1 Tax=Mucilaginibacter sp. 10I4 TaxID=3048580 RepID=UPI002B22C0B1|nr:bifunctional metallophosphatase/5'-nucleotidase [Mucilaginibacter sp. 10I4]MEB0260713.1 bifunctional metallophosphatase/5'-nucleotidase [Mucilaginibacter sp. 10I4]
MDLSLLYINDIHGYLEPHSELFYHGKEAYTEEVGGYARIASLINELKAANDQLLVFDGGDTFHGTLPLVESKGEAIVPVLNHLGISAMVGHWDFGYGPKQLKHLASQLNYPVLGINVFKDDGSLFLEPYTFVKAGTLKIAVIGICCDIIDKTMPKQFSEGLKFTDGIQELPAYIRGVKEQGADLIFLLSHNGLPQDVALLNQVNGIDVCLSAHTHNRLYETITVNKTLVIQCGCHGSFAGHLQLTIDEGKIIGHQYDLLPLDGRYTDDPTISEMTDKIMEPYRKLQQEKVANTEQILHRYNILSSGMDDFLLTAVCEASGCQIGFSNGWRYGAPVPAGPVSVWDLYNMVPMNPPISTVELSGKEIWEMMEANLESTFSANPMAQMGGYVKRCFGLQLYIKIENPKGTRIQQLFAGNELVNPEKVYQVAFVTSQSVPEKFGKNRKDLPIKTIEALKQYCIKYGIINLAGNQDSVKAI